MTPDSEPCFFSADLVPTLPAINRHSTDTTSGWQPNTLTHSPKPWPSPTDSTCCLCPDSPRNVPPTAVHSLPITLCTLGHHAVGESLFVRCGCGQHTPGSVSAKPELLTLAAWAIDHASQTPSDYMGDDEIYRICFEAVMVVGADNTAMQVGRWL